MDSEAGEWDFGRERTVSVASTTKTTSTSKRILSYGLSSRMSRLATPRLLSARADFPSTDNRPNVEQLVLEKTLLAEATEAYKGELERLREENGEFRTLLEWKGQQERESDARLETLKAHNNHLVARIGVLQSQLLAKGQKASKNLSQITNPEGSESEIYRAELSEKIRANEQLQDRLSFIQAEMQHEIDRLKGVLDEQRASLEESSLKNVKANEEKGRLKGQLELVEQENESLRRQSHKATTQLAQSEESGRQLVTKLEAAEQEKSRLGGELASLKSRANDLEIRSAKDEALIRQLREKDKRDADALKEQQVALDAALKQLDDSHKQADDYKQQVETLEADLAKTNIALSLAQNRASALETECSQQRQELESFLSAAGSEPAKEGSPQAVSITSSAPYILKIKNLQVQNQWLKSVAHKYHNLYSSSVRERQS